MGIPVKATCSECMTIHYPKLEFGQENIHCPACGHSMKNLPEGELNEMDLAMKGQRTNQIIALIAFLIGAGSFLYWATGTIWIFGGPVEKPTDFMTTQGWFALACVMMLLSIVFGFLGSRRRYIIEF
jgi:hypothetical protein